MKIDDERLRQALLSEATIAPTALLPSTQMWSRLAFRRRFLREPLNSYWDSATAVGASLLVLVVILLTVPSITFSLLGLLVPAGAAAFMIGSARVA